MKNYLFIICFLLSSILTLSAQTVREYEYDATRSFKINPRSNGVIGTPFLYDNAQLGQIVLQGGKVYDSIPFNIYWAKNQLYIQNQGEKSEPFVVKNWEKIVTKEALPRVFVPMVWDSKPRVVELVYEATGKQVVGLHEKTLLPPTGQRDGYSGPQYDQFRLDVRYYLLEGSNKKEIKLSGNGIKDLAADKYEILREFVRKEKLKPEDPVSMKRILRFLWD